MKINWKVRGNNLYFWIGLIAAVLLLAEAVAKLFGVSIELSGLGEKLNDIVKSVFGILVILGVVNDPTTAGMADSNQAMTYIKPKEDK